MKKLISLLLAMLMVLAPYGVFADFPDVDSDTASWAGEAIGELADAGIISGYEDGTFRPHGNVTRAEFAKMLCIAFEYEAKAKVMYADVSEHWAKSYIEKTSDVVYTYGEYYNPDADATRAEIAYALACTVDPDVDLTAYDYLDREWREDEALIKELVLRSHYADSVLSRFSDSGSVEAEMKYYVATAVDAGFIKGYDDGTIRGNAGVTRAEAATLIFRTMNYESASEENEPSYGETDEENINSDEPGKTNDPDNKNDAANDESEPDEDIRDELMKQGHIYTLYPQKNLLLISSVAKLTDKDGNEDYKLRYYVANTGDEFESVVDGDTVVAGIRGSVDEIRSGDVLFMDTAFWGRIGCLFVLASPKHNGEFAAVYPNDEDWSLYPGTGEYEVFGGKLLGAEIGSKVYTLTVQSATKTEELSVLRSVSVDIYDVNSKRSGWENDNLSVLADAENTWVFVRYTDGRASEVVAFVY